MEPRYLLACVGLAAAVAITVPTAQADDEMDAKFAMMDANGDGKISDDEHEDFAEKHFKMVDKDGDGFLTQEEIKTARKAMHGKG